jgi:hypothetical protein
MKIPRKLKKKLKKAGLFQTDKNIIYPVCSMNAQGFIKVIYNPYKNKF